MTVPTPLFIGLLVAALTGGPLLTAAIFVLAWKWKKAKEPSPPPVLRAAPAPSPMSKPQMQWFPQPEIFNAAEHQLIIKITQRHILDRVEQFRYHLTRLSQTVTWKESTQASPEKGKPTPQMAVDLGQIFHRHSYTYANTQLDLELLARLLCSDRDREYALVHLISYILMSNISLDGESSWSLVSPDLLNIWNACRHSHTGKNMLYACLHILFDLLLTSKLDAWNQWAWQKARVYLCQNLWPALNPSEATTYECLQEPLQPDANMRIMALLQDLMDPFITVKEGTQERIRHCLASAAYLGLFIHKDLRPWAWSFEFPGGTPKLADVVPVDQNRWRDQSPNKDYAATSLLQFSDGKPLFKSPILPLLSAKDQSPFLRLGENLKVPSNNM